MLYQQHLPHLPTQKLTTSVETNNPADVVGVGEGFSRGALMGHVKGLGDRGALSPKPTQLRCQVVLFGESCTRELPNLIGQSFDIHVYVDQLLANTTVISDLKNFGFVDR